MKADDLMIGDWVSAYNIYPNIEPLKKVNLKICDPITPGGFISAVAKGRFRADEYDESDLYPVPISPEILEKNGFKPNMEYQGRIGWGWGGGLLYAFIFKHDSGRYMLDCEDKCEGHFDGFIDSVHELQHALKACKINKEIEL